MRPWVLYASLGLLCWLAFLLSGAKSGVNVYIRAEPFQSLDFEANEKPNSMDVMVVVHAGQTRRFVSDLSGIDVPVTWSVSSGPGAISDGGVYSPPLSFLSGTQSTVTATTVGAPRQSGSALIVLR